MPTHLQPRILLLGSTGQLGQALYRFMPDWAMVMAIGRQGCDLNDLIALNVLLDNTQPDVIVNAAAFTQVELAETRRREAETLNHFVPAVLARYAGNHDCLLLHYSTDYVFDGQLSGGYTEADTPNPLNCYGQSKLAGEEAIRADCPQHVILRTSWLHAPHHGNFVTAILHRARLQEAFCVVNDQFGSPTSAQLLAQVSAQLVRDWLAARQKGTAFPYGLYHCASCGAVSRYDLALYIVQEALRLGLLDRVHTPVVQPVATGDYPSVALRPLSSVLDSRLIQKTFGLSLPDWKVGIRAHLRELS